MICNGIGTLKSFPDTPITPAAEDGKGILECGYTNTSYMMRSWYKGEHKDGRLPGPEPGLFSQLSVGNVECHNACDTMSADNETFAMTFDKVSFDDDGYFTCLIINASGQLESSVVRLYVYSK